MKYKIIIDRAEKEIEADTLYDASIIAAELAEQVTIIEEVKDEKCRYKTCGYGNPVRDESGHYDEVECLFFNNDVKWCGEINCPLDQIEREEER